MTGSDVAMLSLTLAGFVLIAMLPYAAFRVVELAEGALDRFAADHEVSSFRPDSRHEAQRLPEHRVPANRTTADRERVPARH